MFDLIPRPGFFFDQDSGGDSGSGAVSDDGGSDENLEEIQSLRKQLEGVETVMGQHGNKFDGLQTAVDSIVEKLDTLGQKPETDDDDGYVGVKQLNSELATLKEEIKMSLGAVQDNLVQTLVTAGQQSTLQKDQNLSTEQMVLVREYAEKNTGGNLKAAHLVMTEEKLLENKELLKKGKKRSRTPSVGGGGGETSDDPAEWMRNNEWDRFEKWRDGNPQEYEEWKRKRQETVDSSA